MNLFKKYAMIGHLMIVVLSSGVLMYAGSTVVEDCVVSESEQDPFTPGTKQVQENCVVSESEQDPFVHETETSTPSSTSFVGSFIHGLWQFFLSIRDVLIRFYEMISSYFRK